MKRKRRWWVVRDKCECDAAYDTKHEAINEIRNWWMIEYPEFAPYRLIRCESSETEIDLSQEEIEK